MFNYYLVYKPFNTLSQFTREAPDDQTLSDLGFEFPPDVYPVGRLDKDSEGLLLLTNDNELKTGYLNPKSKTPKTYWVQVEGAVTDEAIALLSKGVTLSDKGKKWKTMPAQAKRIHGEPALPPRNPPIRVRKEIPTSWLELTIVEGKNRQVRRMTAAVGFPTLRLVRTGIGPLRLEKLQPGRVRLIERPAL